MKKFNSLNLLLNQESTRSFTMEVYALTYFETSMRHEAYCYVTGTARQVNRGQSNLTSKAAKKLSYITKIALFMTSQLEVIINLWQASASPKFKTSDPSYNSRKTRVLKRHVAFNGRVGLCFFIYFANKHERP